MLKLLNTEITGKINAPPSKSMMQRAIAISFLSKEKVHLKNPSFCNDSNASIEVIKQLGKNVKYSKDTLIINGFQKIFNKINCNESGLCIRMFTPILSLFQNEVLITGNKTLLNRPMAFMKPSLTELGVKFKTTNGFLPLKIKGPITKNNCHVDGSLSSQFLTGLLIALPTRTKDTKINVNNLKSIGYIDMTLDIIKKFGVEIEKSNYKHFYIKGNQSYNRKIPYEIEGDWSSAAYFLVAGAISNKIEVNGLNLNSKQPDKSILDILNEVGTTIKIENNKVIVSKNNLNSFVYNAENSPDLFPILVVLASFCKGRSTIYGVNRLIHKESNRAQVIYDEFSKIGINLEIDGNKMHIHNSKIQGNIINVHNDHRIAMAAAIAGTCTKQPIVINNENCVNKSYENFWNDYKKVGGKYE